MHWSGGCLCGSIRYRAAEAPRWAAHCHCAMCRKVSGAAFLSFVEFRAATFEWTRGSPARYQSSSGVARGYCPDCGSTLTYESDDLKLISLGTLDEPADVLLESHCFTDSRLPCIKLTDGLPQYPGTRGWHASRPS